MKAEVETFFNSAEISITARQRRQDLARQLLESSFSIEAYELQDNSHGAKNDFEQFGLIMKPNAAAKRQFALDREILLWRTTYPNFQARDLQGLTAAMRKYQSRVSQRFCILVSDYPRDSINNMELLEKGGPTIIHLSPSDLTEMTLDSCLRKHLTQHDFFDVGGAAVRATDFYGRADLLDSLVHSVEKGGAKIGLFGLRKMGKTSLLNRVGRRIADQSKLLSARLDLQWIVTVDDSVEYLLWALGDALYKSHGRLKKIKDFQIFGRDWGDVYGKEKNIIRACFIHDLQEIFYKNIKICLLIDEVERLFELGSSKNWVDFWRIIRGIDQSYEGQFSIIVFGTNSECITTPHIDNMDNPAFEYLSARYLEPLGKKDAEKLLVENSALMGISMLPDAIGKLFSWSGGHPAILRSLGSTMVSNRNGTWGETVDLEQIIQHVSDYKSAATPVVSQVIAVMERKDSVYIELLTYLAKHDVGTFKEVAQLYVDEIAELKKLGIILTSPLPAIRIDLLADTLRRSELPQTREVPSLGKSLTGTTLNDLVFHERIARGGFADVYRVVNSRNEEFAIKVFLNLDYEYIDREVDALQQFSHPNIVKFLDVIYTEVGNPCIQMEYLTGRSLATRCDSLSKPTTAELCRLLRDCLEALCYLHEGKFATVDQPLIGEAQKSREGYVHRDIKPENIIEVPGRGAVLIDFNIAIRAGSQMLTRTATEAYIPYHLGGAWGPAHDLYALGITFQELACGARIDEIDPSEVFHMISNNHGQEVAGLLDTLVQSDTRSNTMDLLSRARKLLVWI